MHTVSRTEALARKLAYDRYDDEPDTTDLARVTASIDAVGLEAYATSIGAWGVCDWCGAGPDVLAIDSTAGARCAVCVDLPLCSWCGEAPDENDGYCDDCTGVR